MFCFAVLQLHREFVRCGADVCQALTFRAGEDNLDRFTKVKQSDEPSGRDFNLAAVRLAREAAGDKYVSISLSESNNYMEGKGKEVVMADFSKQMQFFVDAGCEIDYIVCEVCTFMFKLPTLQVISVKL